MSSKVPSQLEQHRLIVVLGLFLAVVLGLFILLQQSVAAFKRENIEKNMVWMGNSVVYFCSSGFDQLARAGADDDSVETLLKQAESLEMIEDFARNSDFRVAVYEVVPPAVRPLLSSFSEEEEHGILELSLPLFQVVELRLSGQQFVGYVVSFEPWSWQVVLLRRTTSYDNLFTRLHGFYLAFGIMGSILLVIGLLFLRHSEASARFLHENQQALEATLNSLVEAVVVIDAQGGIIRMNTPAERILDLPPDRPYTGRHVSTVLTLVPGGSDRPLPPEAYEADGLLCREKSSAEYLMANADGDEKLMQVRLAVLQGDKRENSSLILSFNDVTEHRAMEKQLQQAQKMEVIGLMAGGVAHDLNNILSGIVSYPELLLLRLPPDSRLRSMVVAMQQSGQRAAAVVADLLTVARGAASFREVAAISDLVREYSESPECLGLLVQYPDVEVVYHYDANVPTIFCSPVHVKKCLLNLMLNSLEAMQGQGRCDVSARKSLVGRELAKRLHIEPGEYSVIAVRDNGPGIDGEDIGHIFEPFYTKKKMGRSGTGLGLAVVWNTMQDHDGTILVQSDSTGSVFEMYFPGTAETVDTLVEDVPISQLRGTGQRVLVVDDDPLQRDIATDFLVELNYTVEQADSGAEAVTLAGKNHYDLLLLDMLMEPGINGRETYEQVLALNPGQKALIVSGFSESEEVKTALSLGAEGMVRKPYTLEQLGLAVKKVLER